MTSPSDWGQRTQRLASTLTRCTLLGVGCVLTFGNCGHLLRPTLTCAWAPDFFFFATMAVRALCMHDHTTIADAGLPFSSEFPPCS